MWHVIVKLFVWKKKIAKAAYHFLIKIF
jgi:hypothetical protein